MHKLLFTILIFLLHGCNILGDGTQIEVTEEDTVTTDPTPTATPTPTTTPTPTPTPGGGGDYSLFGDGSTGDVTLNTLEWNSTNIPSKTFKLVLA